MLTKLEQNKVEAKITKRIHHFDLSALLQLLEHLGYNQDNILFKSSPSFCSQSALLADIEFKRRPYKQVTVWMNWGILGPQTPLPSYIFKGIEDSYGGYQSFVDFVNFFDHHLMKDFIAASFPDRFQLNAEKWENLKNCFIRLAGIKSIGTMHWLMELIFPELDVRVTRRMIQRKVYTGGLRLGTAILGDATALGSLTTVPVDAFAVTLYTDGELTECLKPWPDEAKRRFNEQIAPLLGNMNVNMELFLIIREQSSLARISRGSYLGYDRIRGGEATKRRILIYRGRID